MSSSPPSKKNHWLQFFLPMFLCLVFVLGLIGYRQHKLWMGRTLVRFTVVEPDNWSSRGTTVLLDGRPVISGEKIGLGSHALVVRNDRCETYQTNFFAWYGGVNFGSIALKRATGTLTIRSTPIANVIIVSGPEFRTTLRDVTETSLKVPLDQYQLKASYARDWSETRTAKVTSESGGTCSFAPAFGAIQLTGNRPDVTFELRDEQDSRVLAGSLPALENDLPAGKYRVLASYHNHPKESQISILKGQTNAVPVSFVFGAVRIETTPARAVVTGANGRQLGLTPCELTELLPPTIPVTIGMPGYKAIEVSLAVTPEQTNSFHTNLVSFAYLNAMRDARQSLTNSNFREAMTFVDKALAASPRDSTALELRTNIFILNNRLAAQTLVGQADYIGAIQRLERILQLVPDDAEITEMISNYKRQVPAQQERMRLERLEHGNLAFTNASMANGDAALFATHEFKTSKPVDQVYPAIVEALTTRPAFQIMEKSSPLPETYQIKFKQEFSTYLNTSAGYREGILVCAQIKDDETQILFKILEYKAEAQVKFSIGNLIGTPNSVNYVPISSQRLGEVPEKLRARVLEGVTNVTARIQSVIGQTQPAASPQP